MALARDDTFAAPALVIQYGARAPADTDTTPESMTEYVAPAIAVYYATPAPLIEFVTPLTCDRVRRTGTFCDLFYAQSTVASRLHHGSCHHWCHR